MTYLGIGFRKLLDRNCVRCACKPSHNVSTDCENSSNIRPNCTFSCRIVCPSKWWLPERTKVLRTTSNKLETFCWLKKLKKPNCMQINKKKRWKTPRKTVRHFRTPRLVITQSNDSMPEVLIESLQLETIPRKFVQSFVVLIKKNTWMKNSLIHRRMMNHRRRWMEKMTHCYLAQINNAL